MSSTIAMKFQSHIAVITLLQLVLCFFLSCGQSVIKDGNGSVNFLVVGDWGRKGLYNQSQMAYQLGRIGEDLDVKFIVSTGDNFYEDGLTGVADPSFLQSFSRIYNAKSLQKPWYAVLGNRDYRGDVLAQINSALKDSKNIDMRWYRQRLFQVSFIDYKLFLSALKNGIRYSAFAELFFVDTTPFVDKYWELPNEHSYDWRDVTPRDIYLSCYLEELDDVLSSNSTWKIVIGHHPMRSVGDHGDTKELMQQMLPILERHNVDLYINGHDHCLQHIKRHNVDLYINEHDHCLQHIKSLTSPIRFLTSGGGSKLWKGMKKDANTNGVEMYYEGQGFMSMEINVYVLYSMTLKAMPSTNWKCLKTTRIF